MGVYPIGMALLTFGTNITQARGSAGGSVYSRNKGGGYMRARVTPLNPRSGAQTLVRTNFALNAKFWSGTLTATQRAEWLAFAIANPLVNVLGASIVVSGLAMMMKLNQVLAQLGTGPLTDPPADLSVDAIPQPTTLNVAASGPMIGLPTAAQSAPADTSYYLFASRPLPAGKNPGTSDYRFLGVFPPVAAATVIYTAANLGTAYVARFGAIAVGQNVGFLVAQVSISKGAVTPGLRFTALAS